MSILLEPSKHKLPDLFRELRFGRPANDQRFLTALADLCERKGIGEFTLTDFIGEFGSDDDTDNADYWKGS